MDGTLQDIGNENCAGNGDFTVTRARSHQQNSPTSWTLWDGTARLPGKFLLFAFRSHCDTLNTKHHPWGKSIGADDLESGVTIVR
jgi:hypothetical protein